MTYDQLLVLLSVWVLTSGILTMMAVARIRDGLLIGTVMIRQIRMIAPFFLMAMLGYGGSGAFVRHTWDGWAKVDVDAIEFESAVIEAIEIVAFGGNPNAEAKAADGSILTTSSDAAGPQVRLSNFSRSSCAAVLYMVSEPARSSLVVEKMSGSAQDRHPFTSWQQECPHARGAPDLFLRSSSKS